MKYIILFCALLTIPATALAQKQEGAIDYKKEYAIGLNFNTNGGLIGGLFLRMTNHRSGNNFTTYTFEGVNIKHPKETRYASAITGSTFVGGKTNVLISLRALYGKNIQLFGKAREDGVQMQWLLAAGPAMGLLKPYYIGYQYSSNDVRYEQYDPDKHPDFNKITGYAGFFTGFDELKVKPGICLRSAALFYFGKNPKNATLLEAGFNMEFFTKPLATMAYAEPTSVFTSVYINFGIGFRD